MQGIDRNLINETIFFHFFIDQTERMGEHASIMKELLNLVALAHDSLMVNAVRMILVNYIHASIMGIVISIPLTAQKSQYATVQKILGGKIVTCCFAVWIDLVIIVVHAMKLRGRKLVNVVKRME